MTTTCGAKLLPPRETGKFVTERSNHVTINDAAVDVAAAMLAESFVDELFSMASWKTETLHPKVSSVVINSKKLTCLLRFQVIRNVSCIFRKVFHLQYDIKGLSEKKSPKIFFFQTASEESINFIFVMDTLNFCFWPNNESKQFKVSFNHTVT